MSLYNSLFGTNAYAPVLLQVLGIDQPDGKYESGRFRDIYLADGKIILYTRNGGGNREEYQSIIDKLATHPNYICDYDDDFDCTFASIEFSYPEEHRPLLEKLALLKTKTPQEKFDDLMKEMESGKITSPEGKNALEVGKKIFGQINKAVKNKVEVIEV